MRCSPRKQVSADHPAPRAPGYPQINADIGTVKNPQISQISTDLIRVIEDFSYISVEICEICG
jgi:hypothetical protein